MLSLSECKNIVSNYYGNSAKAEVLDFFINKASEENVKLRIKVKTKGGEEELNFILKKSGNGEGKLYSSLSGYNCFEDLSQSGSSSLDFIHLKVVLGFLASFHANHIKDNPRNGHKRDDEELKTALEGCGRNLRIFPENEFEKNFIEDFLKQMQQQEGFLKVLCHGDLKPENVLFR